MIVERPTHAERFFWETNGYLALSAFLPDDLVTRLREVSFRVSERRRKDVASGNPQTGMTHADGRNTRYFYILDDDPAFLDMMDYPPIIPYVKGLLNEKPHHHASDVIIEYGPKDRGVGWHIDGHDNGYRNLGNPIPFLQLKIGYYLSDMTEPGQGNLTVIPGSHRTAMPPDNDDLQKRELFDGATQICAPAGTAILFHNALWHTAGPWTKDDGERLMLYYAYEHPWMVGSQEHWGYPTRFYNALPPERRRYFHGFVFDPPEQRWG